MIEAAQLIPYRTSSDDFAETKRLKEKFATLPQKRVPLYLTLEEFDEILRWKLLGQYERLRERFKANTEEVIRTVTAAALSLTHPDEEYEIELRLGILCSLRGVGVPVASAILALVFPESYAVVDFRVWRQVFDEERTTFSVADYKRYLREIRRLARELGWTVQEVDLAIWAYDRNNSLMSPSSRAAG
jgi:thermostable 8-oxoguanine DNA glycosylase